MTRIIVLALASLVCFVGPAPAFAQGPGPFAASAPASAPQSLTTDALLDTLQHTAFNYFWNEANTSTGLIKDRNTSWSPCSIASLGFGLSAICVGIDHGWITKTQGRDRVLAALQTLWSKPQGTGTTGTIGYKGLYYHFLEMGTGYRTWTCELSTIDTALLFAGIIDAKQYFSTSDPLDALVRQYADSIYYRADWNFMRNGNPGILMGWKPETGFSGYGQWIGYNEAMILYLLALGSPTNAVPASAWTTWTSGYAWYTYGAYSFVRFPPLFGHQYSHCWINFKFIQDAYMAAKGITYFENSRRATLAQRAYCIANPGHFVGYGPNLWGLTASDGPYGYAARGAPPIQNDDGTITPTAPASSIAFAPDEVIPTLHNMYDTYGAQLWGPYGFKDAFNLTLNWWGPDYIGIDQGPIIIMIENYRTGRVWNRFMQNPDIQRGLQAAGFTSTTGVEGGSTGGRVPVVLAQNTPNPFRGTSSIRFRLAEAGQVSLALFDVAGRRVRMLLEGVQEEGEHEVRLDAAGLPSGVYFYRLEHAGTSLGKPCIVLK